MRSHALQACRPLRLTSPRLQCLVQPAFSASVATTSTSTASSPTPKPAYKPKPRTVLTASKMGPRVPHADPRSPKRNGQMEPQAALSPAPSVEEIDIASARQIPTQATTPSAFIAALGTSPNLNGNSPVSGLDDSGSPIDWSSSFHGLSTSPFSTESAAILQAPINPEDIEIKPDGIVYLPEIKYRRILNAAFGPGGWGLAPRGELIVGEKVVTREYALVVNGRFVGQARGECSYFSEDTIPTAGEGCKSNALMRCCKDLGIASELWDPRFLRTFKKQHGHEVWVEHIVTKKRRQIWKRKDCDPIYPFKLVSQ